MTKNKLPYSNQFERGHSFNWAGKWTAGKYYMNDEYVTDFVVYESAILACRKNHQASLDLEPVLVYYEGKVSDVDSPYWDFIVAINNSGVVTSSTYIAEATEEDKQYDSSIIIGDPYIKIIYSSGAYTYVPAKDLVVGITVGLPTLTQEMLDNLPPESVPDDYILIPDDSDIDEKGSTGSPYVDVLFSAIRKLQAEVAKLRNSFRYGISSYTGTDTATSKIVSEYSNITDDEPLWSIDEDELSEISDATIDFENSFIPIEPRSAIGYDQTGYADILTTATTTAEIANAYKEISDTKIFLYVTVSEPHMVVNLKSLSEENPDIELNFDTIISGYSPTEERYNICVLVSRTMKVDDESDEEYGKNYIWISVGYFNTNRTLVEGYYNPVTGEVQKALVEINDKYYINLVTLSELTIYKFNAYSKYQDFSHEIIQSKPDDSDYKYRAAHITIRAVASLSELQSIEDRLLTDELIWQEDQKILWINGKSGLTAISGSSKPDSGMTVQEMIEKLEELGIVYVDGEGLQLSNVSDVTFINNNTGKKFKFTVDSDGELRSTELPGLTLAQRIQALSGTQFPMNTATQIRGFVSKLFASENSTSPVLTSDLKNDSDRIKIGAVYGPLTTDTKFGCSHGYIELENTSDKDFPLEGCYIHYLHPNSTNPSKLDCEHLALSGILPKGGTYLIRCKQYADPKTDADVFINVDSFDIEWYVNGSLLDLTRNTISCYALALTYGATVGGETVSSATVLMSNNSESDSKAPLVYVYNYIDSLVFNAHPSATSGTWGTNYVSTFSNTIVKNTFELDPAKQAYQALTTYDSSRMRLANVTNDIQYLNLDKEFIVFPNSEAVYPVKAFTPKTSTQSKNVSTDKTQLDKEKPNMVTCAFGIDMYTTRTFNWISAGEFDEYVFIKNGSSWLKFESYKAGDGGKTQATGSVVRKEFGNSAINCIYKRITGDFPGDGSHYTSHKCILILNSGSAVSAKTEFTYVVGRADKNGNPDPEHCSEEFTFTLYPITAVPRIYQITDQQGFHWIEYQVWTAAADSLNAKINADIAYDNTIMPVLINTGDMTQNGTRINEWLDYYNGGKSLFSHLEQMNVVGNNDLCDTNEKILGTGDDAGKSNGYYFHVFYCYEVNESENYLPTITGYDTVEKYIPSLYYFDSTNYRFVMVNSEITYENCKNWFHKRYNNQVVNIYTGWAIPEEGASAGYCSDFTTIYTMLYNILNSKGTKKAIVACHEMPFTVITKDSLTTQANVYGNYRSLSKATNGFKASLVGSHTNQMTGSDVIATHWLSRLLEHFQVKLCIGGHKHTYACTYPVRENYFYTLNGEVVNSLEAPMTMTDTLAGDTSTWVYPSDYTDASLRGYNTSKKPYVKGPVVTSTQDSGYFSPMIVDNNLTGGVTYFMCQATGYKLTSNKELPSNFQHFAKLIPQTGKKADGSDKADGAQQFPMFSIVSMSGDTYAIKLVRIKNIKDNTSHNFTQQVYGTDAPAFEYATVVADSRYCSWSSTETPIISIS